MINLAGEIGVVVDLVPIDGIASLEAEGTVTLEMMEVSDTVFCPGGGSAVGAMALEKSG